jgi:glycine amidinotransferase
MISHLLIKQTQAVFSKTLRPSSLSASFSSLAERAGIDETCVVNSHTEFHPLEEMIVGRVEGATIPEWHVSGKAVWPEKHWDMFKNQKGQPFPEHLIQKATEELDEFSRILELEGVTVRRPEIKEGDFSQGYSTPDFTSNNGLYAAMPRDILITVGNQIIEAPMAWRSRFFEYRPYRSLIKEYFHQGGKWTAAPKPLMSDDLYENEETFEIKEGNFVVTEFEPVFDAAEFTRVGRDLFVQRSQVTNLFGIEWMKRHLGDPYRVHLLDFKDKNAMHIDGTFIPMGVGKLLVNPIRPCITGKPHTHFTYKEKEVEYRLPPMFEGWDIFVAQTPVLPASHPLFFTSPWTASANIIMLDEERVVVEASEEPTIRAFESWGFKTVKVPFRHFLPFGGSFYCATCDVRRRGTLEDYFPDYQEEEGN